MNRKLFYALIVIGIAIQIYLTIVKYDTNLLVCPNTGVVNCESVITSQYSTIFGIPVSILGIVLYLLAVPFVLKYTSTGRFLWSIAALASLAYSFVSQAILSQVCIYCLGFDAITIALLAMIYLDDKRKPAS